MLKKPEDHPGDREDFYRRWSRRKRTHRDQGSTNTQIERSDVGLDQADAPPEKTDADMPSIESLGEESDFSGFMSPKISEKLRKVALRKLFNLPQFGLRDGLDDYDEDYTSFEILGDIITADRRHQMEMEAERNNQEDSKIAGTDPEQSITETPVDIEEVEDPPDQQLAIQPASEVEENNPITVDQNEDESNHNI